MCPDSTSMLSLLLICRLILQTEGLQVDAYYDPGLESIPYFTSVSRGNLVAMVLGNRLGNSFIRLNCFSTSAEAIMIVSVSLSLKSVTSFQVFSIAVDLKLAWVRGICYAISATRGPLGHGIVIGSLQAEIFLFAVLRGGPLRIISHTARYSTH